MSLNGTETEPAWGLLGVPIAPALPGMEARCTHHPLKLLRRAAALAPDALALVGSDARISFAQMIRLVEIVAGQVALRVPAEQAVACQLPRNPHGVAVLLGCLVSGRACVVLDPSDPPGRIAGLLEEAAPALIVQGDETPANWAIPVLGLAHFVDTQQAVAPLDSGWNPDAVMAVHFTSGSTGRPKGIALSGRSVMYRSLHLLHTLQLDRDDRVIANSLPTTSAGLALLLAALIAGARVVLAHFGREGATGFLAIMRAEAVNCLIIPPPLMRVLAGLARARQSFAGLRLVRTGAALLPTADVAAWRAVLPACCPIIHAYASTEALVLAAGRVADATPADVLVAASGVLQPGYDHAIVDENLAPVDASIGGELIVRSRYLASGEWRDGRLVAGAMVPAVGQPGMRVFRTGDIVRITPDGILRVLGRVDRQVKINGVRLELSEIEALLKSQPGVTDAAVLPLRAASGMRLIGFVEAHGANATTLVPALRLVIADRLPGVARLSDLHVVDRFPLLPVGKLDAQALLALAGQG
ncbi:MAG: AMP-binding protein [Acetobacteraceae bacterium]|nr:AMP-binding protein [Acetobacteraceae bacterium]